MIRNLKVLGLALMAVAAMSAVAVSSASAAQFTSAQENTTITANQSTPHVLKVTDQEVTCSTSTFHGTVGPKAVASVTVDPVYTNCKGFLGITATVTGFKHEPGSGAGSCDYVVYANGTVDLVCAAGKDVTVEAAGCTVHIPGQTGIGTIGFANGTVGGVGDITATLAINNIKGTHTDGFLCPFSGGGSFTNGTLTGTSTITGETALGVPVGISWDS